MWARWTKSWRKMKIIGIMSKDFLTNRQNAKDELHREHKVPEHGLTSLKQPFLSRMLLLSKKKKFRMAETLKLTGLETR